MPGAFSQALSQANVFSISFSPTEAAAELAVPSVLWKRVLRTQSANIPSVPSAELSQRLRLDENRSTSHSFVECVGPTLQPTGHWGSASWVRRTGSRPRGTGFLP